MSEDPKPKTDKPSSGFASFWAELKRRKVMRVAITYAVVGWIILQVAGLTFEGFGIPIWAFRFVMLMVILGFPLAIILAWAFELSPDGIKTTKSAREERGGEPASNSQQSSRNWMAFAFAAGLPTLIFGAFAIFFYLRSGNLEAELSHKASSGQATSFGKSIAVLPFTNMSPDPGNAYFADGIHETILTTLANLGELRVTSRTSVIPYRDSDKSIPTIGEELNVAHILEGSVQRIGDEFRLTAQLIKAGTDEHLWAKNYDGEFKDVFSVQSQLAREISDSLKAVLSPEDETRLNAKPTDNLEAYDLYLQSLAPESGRSQSISFLEKTITLDPNFTLAWVRLSLLHTMNYLLGVNRTAAGLRKARDPIYEALSQDPENPDVLRGMGFYFYGCHKDYAIAEYFYRQVQKKIPNHAGTYWSLGVSYRREGRWREAIESFESAYRLEPQGGNGRFLANTLRWIHDWENSNRVYTEREVLMDPDERLVMRISAAFLSEGTVFNIDDLNGVPTNAKVGLSWAFGDADKVLEFMPVERRSNDRHGRESNNWMISRSESWRYAIALQVSGRRTEAEISLAAYRDRLLQKSVGNDEDDLTLGMLGLVQAVLGDADASMRSFEGATALTNEEMDAFDGVTLSINKAIALAWLGRKDEAVVELERLIKIPSLLNVHLMRHCLDFYPLRDHAGFQAILDDPANHQPLDLDTL